jgi:hypothetical protein
MPKDLSELVRRQQAHNAAIERDELDEARFLPGNYFEYSILPIDDRVEIAIQIFRGLAPNCDSGSKEMPKDATSFDITRLLSDVEDEDASVSAEIAYAEGSLPIGAKYDPDVDTLPSLKLYVTTTSNGYWARGIFAKLEEVPHYDPNGYIDSSVTGYSFRVRPPEDDAEVIEDHNDPLFQDVIKVVDLGISNLYSERLSRLFTKLGETGLASN